MSDSSTIVAIITPPGRAGIGVIRLSGPHSLTLLQSLLSDKEFNPARNRSTLKNIYDPVSHELLDQSLITFFPRPASFTGEDVVEISCHGSPVLLSRLCQIFLQSGARLAEPGEFTLRAFTNGRINLSQAEAVRDLVDARTEASLKAAARQLRGETSHIVNPLKVTLVEAIVLLESQLEFVEDDLPAVEITSLSETLSRLVEDLVRLCSTFSAGRVLRDGLRVVLVGRPNVGKSSLFNYLLAHERAIVTEIAGTTRDTITEVLEIDGVAVALTDTAGLRESTDVVEYMGIERTRRSMFDADVVLLVIDGIEGLSSDETELLMELEGARVIIALNKSDLKTFRDDWPGLEAYKDRVYNVSATKGYGIEELKRAIVGPFQKSNENYLVTNSRHFDLLNRAREAVSASNGLLTARASEELVLVGLYQALALFGELTGETTPDDVLSQIFSTFCIGK